MELVELVRTSMTSSGRALLGWCSALLPWLEGAVVRRSDVVLAVGHVGGCDRSYDFIPMTLFRTWFFECLLDANGHNWVTAIRIRRVCMRLHEETWRNSCGRQLSRVWWDSMIPLAASATATSTKAGVASSWCSRNQLLSPPCAELQEKHGRVAKVRRSVSAEKKMLNCFVDIYNTYCLVVWEDLERYC